MSVQKIFMTLIIVVACVILGAFVLNALLPNVIAGMSNAAEDMLKNATGINFDVNGDGVGTAATNKTGKGTSSSAGAGVSGYDAAGDKGTNGGGKNSSSGVDHSY